MTTLYLAGPMSGLPDFNYPAFYKAAEQLREAGYVVENPAENSPENGAGWLDFMRLSLVQISKVDGIALLPGWESSRGAKIEAQLGDDLGLDLQSVEGWISQAELEKAHAEVKPTFTAPFGSPR